MMSSLKETQAESYEHGSQSQRGAGMQLIANLDIPRGSNVLDLGCGTGSLTKALSNKVGSEGKVVAVDPDGERIQLAKMKYPASNTEYVQANDSTFPPGKYDLVYCNATIHWIHDKKALFKRVYQNLRPGGQFAFTTPDGGLPIPDIGMKLFNELLGNDFLHKMHNLIKLYLTADEYKTLARDTGFIESSFTTENLYPEWKDLDHYIDSMYGWFGGAFDPAEFDNDGLLEIKKEYGDGPVVQTEPIRKLEIILVKPVN